MSERRFLLLMISLLLLSILHQFTLRVSQGPTLFFLLFSLVMVMASLAIENSRRLLITFSILVPLALILTWSRFATEQFVLLSHLVNIVFLGIVTIRVLRDVLVGCSVTHDRICGAVCVYFLIGVIWSVLYSSVFHLEPDAFELPIAASGEDELLTFTRQQSHLMYFSFVTLSTLGYGDITPQTAPAQTLAWLEAIVGQLYLAILLARLVGLQIASVAANRERSDQ